MNLNLTAFLHPRRGVGLRFVQAGAGSLQMAPTGGSVRQGRGV